MIQANSGRNKFLFVIDNLNTGGAQRQMINLALGLVTKGYHVEFFCYAAGDELAEPLYEKDIPIHWRIKRHRYSLDVILELNKIINREKFDLILSFLTTPNFYSILVSQILRLNRIPVIVSERRVDLPQGPSVIEQLVRQFYRLASHITTNSFNQKNVLIRQYPWLQSHISTIYNGYDLDIFRPAIPEIDNYPIKILSIASVVPHKNALCLLEAINILQKRDGLYPQVDWVGRQITQSNNAEYSNKMNALLYQYRLDKQWNWMDLRSDIIEQIHQHDVLVHPSFVEGLPNVVCEALACGKPVIVSDTMDHSKLVQSGKNGYLFDPMNPTDLADKINLFMKLSITERRKMGEYSRYFAEANLSQKRLADDYEKLFQTIIQSKKSGKSYNNNNV